MANVGYDFIWTETQHGQRHWRAAARGWRTCAHARRCRIGVGFE
jgi:hypothetical protein